MKEGGGSYGGSLGGRGRDDHPGVPTPTPSSSSLMLWVRVLAISNAISLFVAILALSAPSWRDVGGGFGRSIVENAPGVGNDSHAQYHPDINVQQRPQQQGSRGGGRRGGGKGGEAVGQLHDEESMEYDDSGSILFQQDREGQLQVERHLQMEEEEATCHPLGEVSFSCPNEEGHLDFHAEGTVVLHLSERGKLCTLIRVPSASASSSSSSASSAALMLLTKSFQPIARSYGGHDWEATAGDFSSKMSFYCRGGMAASCAVTLPPLPPDGSLTYRLTTYDSPPLVKGNADIIARFLEQTTFGPTRDEIANITAAIDADSADSDASFDDRNRGGGRGGGGDGGGGDGGFHSGERLSLALALAQYTKYQMELPPTSHRQIYRTHVNARMEFPTYRGAVTHPCQRGTRYRRFAFSEKDEGLCVQIDTIGGTDRRALTVEGTVRTVVSGLITHHRKSQHRFGDGTYLIKRTDGANRIGGHIWFEHPTQGRTAVRFDGEYGNPSIQFDPTLGVEPEYLVTIPPSGAVYTDGEYFQETAGDGGEAEQELILTEDLDDPVCSSLPTSIGDPPIVFALYGGRYWMHDPRFVTLNNTVEMPDPSGGGELAQSTKNDDSRRTSCMGETISYDDFGTRCANVPRTFLNEEHCVLSHHPDSCVVGSSGTDTGGGDGGEPSSLLDFPIRMTDEVLRTMYEVTGNGGTPRYVYAVEGLRIEDDSDADRPCDPVVSRWAKLDSCPDGTAGGAGQVDPIVNAIFSTLISDELQRQQQQLEPASSADLVDVFNGQGTPCPPSERSKVGFVVRVDGVCYQNVHPDHLSVWDMTYWVSNHPGGPDKIRYFAEVERVARLRYPSHHEMFRWQSRKRRFGFVASKLGDVVEERGDLPTELRYALELSSGILVAGTGNAIVCGSPNEVANDLMAGGSIHRGAFDSNVQPFDTTSDEDFDRQKRLIWTRAVLKADDQLRQRAAWALSQILVVSPKEIDKGERSTEALVAYYDVLVRHAFGNYRDVLKEVSYSPVMAEMLTYYGGQSTAYVWRRNRNLEYADENFAREIMQLFTTGFYKLHPDGNQVMVKSGTMMMGGDTDAVPMQVYTNDDIVEYARAWTGFESQRFRGNVESVANRNRIDPMQIRVDYRDPYPKMGLERTYVGHGYPLCSDLPRSGHFLERGAKYRLLGSNPRPELHSDPDQWISDPAVVRLTLSRPDGKSLFSKLCGSTSDSASSSTDSSNCQFGAVVILDEDVPCHGAECLVETVRLVEVEGMFYEYVPPPCVHQAFFPDPKLVIRRGGNRRLACADPRTLVASTACCDRRSRTWNDVYWGERTTYATSASRCADAGGICSSQRRPPCNNAGTYCDSKHHYWTTNPCTLRVKISGEGGNVGIVHAPQNIDDDDVEDIYSFVAEDTKTYFRVDWSLDDGGVGGGGDEAAAMAVENLVANCGTNSCQPTIDGECMCDVSVVEEQVFFDGDNPSLAEIVNGLSIGSFNPFAMGQTVMTTLRNGIVAYTQDGTLTSDSVFEFADRDGNPSRRKNVRSTVRLDGTSLSFRNPVHFVSLSDPETQEAHDETEAVLDHYFYHPSTAPFLAIRFAQRFGLSNPSPRYVEKIGRAFRTGSYVFSDGTGPAVSFGTGKYGDLAATFACVLLDREARSIELDADPTHGSLREPLLKVVGLMRSMELEMHQTTAFTDFDIDAGNQIGQMVHDAPSIFSFFLPEYGPPGLISQAGLVAPEAQTLSGSRLIGTLNGYMSMIRYGFGACCGGFASVSGYDVKCKCDDYRTGVFNSGTEGRLDYSPPTTGTSDEDLVDDVATLLTAGRLSPSSRDIVLEAVSRENDEAVKIARAQELVTFTPEFHGTSLVRTSGEERPELQDPQPSNRPYKAIVYFFLKGGMDSYNMLVPHECVPTNDAGRTLREQYEDERTSVALTDAERTLIINASGQHCTQFAVHPDLPLVEELYREGDLAFFANAGVLDRPSTKDNYRDVTRTQLFAHNTMQQEAQRIDPFDRSPGTGVLGRACDVLIREGSFNAQPITVEDATVATVGAPGAGGADPLLVSPRGTQSFNERPSDETWNPRPYLDRLNDAIVPCQSSVFGETWSANIQKALHDNGPILDALSNTELTNTFPDTDEGGKLEAVAKLIASHEKRGSDRDVFYVSSRGWDLHNNLKEKLSLNFQDLDGAFALFVEEMRSLGRWDDVTVVLASEFARTLTANSNEGSDHAWGGHYFMMGGSVKGGEIYGEYPPDITPDGPANVGRGRVIPSLSWESVWHGVLDWFGVPPSAMDECLPNRHETGARMFTKEEVFDP